MAEELSETDVFVLLSERRRRLTLRILRESTGELTATQLAARITDRENGSSADEDLKNVYLSLYHNHLPRLEAADVVKYDGLTGIVRPWVNYDTVVRVMESADQADTAWTDE
jgi:hypothetical protein